MTHFLSAGLGNSDLVLLALQVALGIGSLVSGRNFSLTTTTGGVME